MRDDFLSALPLFISWFLHQTTTQWRITTRWYSCLSLDSYIKPQLTRVQKITQISCLSLDSYIKPQQRRLLTKYLPVVYLLIPTSNHNFIRWRSFVATVVYLLIPTSNHNEMLEVIANDRVVYLLIPTSNHNRRPSRSSNLVLFISWFLHQTTTCWMWAWWPLWLFISWFLHQTTTPSVADLKHISLFISWFLHQTTTYPSTSRDGE